MAISLLVWLRAFWSTSGEESSSWSTFWASSLTSGSLISVVLVGTAVVVGATVVVEVVVVVVVVITSVVCGVVSSTGLVELIVVGS